MLLILISNGVEQMFPSHFNGEINVKKLLFEPNLALNCRSIVIINTANIISLTSVLDNVNTFKFLHQTVFLYVMIIVSIFFLLLFY